MLMSDVDEITNQVALVKAVNLKHKTVNETLTAELERYKERIKQIEDRQNVDLNDREKYIDSKMNDMIRNRNAKYVTFEKEIETLKSNLSKTLSRLYSSTVRFGNDQIARIMGYGDYQLGNVIISRVYYIEGLGHNLFSVGQFCDADLEVAFRKNTCFIRNLEASKTKSWLWHPCALGKSKKTSHQPKAEDTNQEKLYILHMDLCGPMRVASINGKRNFVNGMKMLAHQTSVARTPQKNGVVERQNRTLVEAARTMLIFSNAPLFLWVEAINTACYTQNRSLIRLR
ncbi:retrovirus-related pol polyprotein from transposon TNT 1-94 [Tanacetum coccineum]